MCQNTLDSNKRVDRTQGCFLASAKIHIIHAISNVKSNRKWKKIEKIKQKQIKMRGYYTKRTKKTKYRKLFWFQAKKTNYSINKLFYHIPSQNKR